MLKIRDDIDLKKLEKYGFKIKKYYYKTIVLEYEDKIKGKDIVFNLKTRKLCFCNSATYDTLYDLIKADLVDKVEER